MQKRPSYIRANTVLPCQPTPSTLQLSLCISALCLPAETFFSRHTSPQLTTSSSQQISNLLCKADVSSTEQQHGALQRNLLALQMVQILLTTVVAIHQPALETQRRNEKMGHLSSTTYVQFFAERRRARGGGGLGLPVT